MLQTEISVPRAADETVPTDRCAANLSAVLDWRQISIVRIGYLPGKPPRKDTASIEREGEVGMPENSRRKLLRVAMALATLAAFSASALPAIKNMAVVASANSKLTDLPLAELVKMCKGTSKAWPDGKSFVLVLRNPDSPELHGVLQKLFGGGAAEAKTAIAKLNETHLTVKIVNSDEELLRTVDSTPGAIGIVDVYAINSSVKVLRIDGRLPFDVGYALKGN